MTSSIFQSRVPLYSTSMLCDGRLAACDRAEADPIRLEDDIGLTDGGHFEHATWTCGFGPIPTRTVCVLGPVNSRVSKATSMVVLSPGWRMRLPGVAVTQPQPTRRPVISTGAA